MYDAVCAEGLLTDSQRNMFYAELIKLKEMGLRLQDPFPVGWKKIVEYAPVQFRGEIMKEIESREQQQAQAAQQQQQTQQMAQQLALQQAQIQAMSQMA